MSLTLMKKTALAAGIVAAVAASGSALAAGQQITGAGSTWVYPLISKWAAAYEPKTHVAVNYQAIGSGGGIQQITAGTVDFGASDMPLKSEDLRKSKLIQFPTAIAGEDLVVNLPGIKPGDLILSGQVVADIYLGKITNWNDPAIQSLNKGVTLPDQAIAVVHRSDGSGTTFTFANYLSKVSPEWAQKVGANTAINWPTGLGGKGNAGVAAFVQQINGAIGYVEYAYIQDNHMTWVRMFNHDGKLVSPTLQSFQAAAKNVDFTKAEDFYVILTDQPGAESWPISGGTWEIMRTDVAKEKNKPVLDFFTWGYENGQKMAEDLGYGPLPESTVKAIKDYWKKNLGLDISSHQNFH